MLFVLSLIDLKLFMFLIYLYIIYCVCEWGCMCHIIHIPMEFREQPQGVFVSFH